ncbi:MAG TPA: peptidase U32 family protein [Rhodocyclaceae bacterium]
MFELSTNLANPKDLRVTDISAYDAIYLGDFSCAEYPNNFSSNSDVLAAALENIHAQGKKCYLRLYAVPSNHDLPWVRDHLKVALALPFDGYEVHNMGLLRVLRDMGCTAPIHLGVFGNLYTHETARVLKDYGVTRVYPNPELSLKEIVYIQDEAPVEVLAPVHGKIPLVISETCFIMEHTDGGASECNFFCSKDHWLERGSGDWSLKDTGRMTLSGKDLCMLEHLPEMLERGLTAFYIQSHGEGPEYIATAGRIYRAALEKAAAGQPASEDEITVWLAELGELARKGLCNGYYFESAGQRYVDAKQCGDACSGGCSNHAAEPAEASGV